MSHFDFEAFCRQVHTLYTRSECRVLWNAYQDYKTTHPEFSGLDEVAYAEALSQGKPYQHILGMADFFGVSFLVNAHTLIPRPETEELLEWTIQMLAKYYSKDEKFKVLEIGTGTGIIPIILKQNFPEADVHTVDISREAIEVAKKNAQVYSTEISFFQTDYLAWKPEEKYDVIISNPPYIGREEMEDMSSTVVEFEPHIALFSPTEDVLVFYRKIAQDAQEILNDGGMIFLEINQRYGEETLALFEDFSQRELRKDLSQNDRIVWARR